MKKSKTINRQKIRYRIRKKISGTEEMPRLSVFKSNTGIYCQLIDDTQGITLCAASSKEKDMSKGSKSEMARQVGNRIASRALAKNISRIVFDRGGFIYHGRIKALAEAAREGGLAF
ncbi:MAG: 50S ribosomal protein L18 [Saprospiraceae bacterium]|jgi:large subunit ribosomal protein L18|nr:50S ribosomal protein L18 [Saprospiraceae bacterium]MBP9209257.1 50S ribosomal protein L18 [Saprospiraceae bacterium]MBV6473034.1 50S ribosomal protein L18 [Saprospiraceae bacterium]